MSSASEPTRPSDPVVEETTVVEETAVVEEPVTSSAPPASPPPPVVTKTTRVEKPEPHRSKNDNTPQELWAIIATVLAVLGLLLAFVSLGVAKNAHNRIDDMMMQMHHSQQESRHSGHDSRWQESVPCGCLSGSTGYDDQFYPQSIPDSSSGDWGTTGTMHNWEYMP